MIEPGGQPTKAVGAVGRRPNLCGLKPRNAQATLPPVRTTVHHVYALGTLGVLGAIRETLPLPARDTRSLLPQPFGSLLQGSACRALGPASLHAPKAVE